MAQQKKARAAQATERETTARTVLRRERVLVLRDGATVEQVVAAKNEGELRKLLADQDKAGAHESEAWRVIGEFSGQSDTRAIEAYAGKAGQPDSKPGAYKAPPSRSWVGGELYEKPPEPKVERRRLEE